MMTAGWAAASSCGESINLVLELRTMTHEQLSIGCPVTIAGVKNAVICQVIKLNKRNHIKSLYLVEYTVDDQLARDTGETKRHVQPFYGSQISLNT
jgi:hypothetical protein